MLSFDRAKSKLKAGPASRKRSHISSSNSPSVNKRQASVKHEDGDDLNDPVANPSPRSLRSSRATSSQHPVTSSRLSNSRVQSRSSESDNEPTPAKKRKIQTGHPKSSNSQAQSNNRKAKETSPQQEEWSEPEALKQYRQMLLQQSGQTASSRDNRSKAKQNESSRARVSESDSSQQGIPKPSRRLATNPARNPTTLSVIKPEPDDDDDDIVFFRKHRPQPSLTASSRMVTRSQPVSRTKEAGSQDKTPQRPTRVTRASGSSTLARRHASQPTRRRSKRFLASEEEEEQEQEQDESDHYQIEDQESESLSIAESVDSFLAVRQPNRSSRSQTKRTARVAAKRKPKRGRNRGLRRSQPPPQDYPTPLLISPSGQSQLEMLLDRSSLATRREFLDLSNVVLPLPREPPNLAGSETSQDSSSDFSDFQSQQELINTSDADELDSSDLDQLHSQDSDQSDDSDDSQEQDQLTSENQDSPEIEQAQPNHRAVDKHWETCRRCNEKPALSMYKSAVTRRNRLEKKQLRKRESTGSFNGMRSERSRYLHGMFEENVAQNTPLSQVEEWIETLTERAGWIECCRCSASWHWGCLSVAHQKLFLAKINAERQARHSCLAQPGVPPPSILTKIEINEVLDSVMCPDCITIKSTCMTCKADQQGKRLSESEGGLKPDELARLPSPPSKPATGRFFRCRRCSRCSHYECLPKDTFGQTPERRAKAAQELGWRCRDCRTWPEIDVILAWRPLDPKLWSDRDIRKRSYPAHSPKEQLSREYLIKFEDKSFRETVWVPHEWLSIINAIKLKHFLEKGTRIELEPAQADALALGGTAADLIVRKPKSQPVTKALAINDVGDVDFGPPGPQPNAQERIPKPWKTPDRILHVKFLTSVQTNDYEPSGQEIDIDEVKRPEVLSPDKIYSSWPHVSRMLVKWQDQGYEKCTWEKLPSTQNDFDIYSDLQKAYRVHLQSRSITFPEWTEQVKNEKRNRHKTLFRPLDKQPPCISGGQLLDFQLEGVNWLLYGWHNHQPGILADEMGLGKTVQIITFLGTIWTEYKAGPFLVVVPGSTLPNWMREFEKWLPQLRVVPYWGEAKGREMIHKYEFFHSKAALDKFGKNTRSIKADVVVCSDTTFRNDSLPLRKVGHWDAIIVDEGQNLKSGESVLLKKLNELAAEHRIIMTGTPLNNNIGELFNLLNWLEPGGQFKSIKELKQKYEVLTSELIQELQPKLKPYFLRRVKAEVLNLPPKLELIVPISLRPIQKRIYRSILEHNIEDIQALADGRTDKKKQTKVKVTNLNNVLMQLRKCIQHPYLIAPDLELEEGEAEYEATWEHQRLVDASAKLSLLQRLLPKLQKSGHRVLLFSQFVINLNLVEAFLSGEGYKYLRLDGSLGQKQRQRDIDAFNAPNSDYFIYMISTRAGGVGINLATADTVIIFDPDFNPHVDMQAIARAHRIGQKKKVLVLTLMCKGTAEESIIEGAKKKMVLDHLIVQNLNEDDCPDALQSILKFGALALFDEGGLDENEKDVRYTEDDLDTLLNRREEDESDTANGLGGGSSAGNFSFARVWEKDNSAAQTDTIEPVSVVDGDFWEDLLAKHRETVKNLAALEEQKASEDRKLRRTNRIRTMLQADEDVEDSATKRPPGRRQKKQVDAARHSDDEFVVDHHESASDDEHRPQDAISHEVKDLENPNQKRMVSKPHNSYQIPFNGAAAATHSSATAATSMSAANNDYARLMSTFDPSVPVQMVDQSFIPGFYFILNSLPADFAKEIRCRSDINNPPILPAAALRNQLAIIHVHFFANVFRVSKELFLATFTIIPEAAIPDHILRLPYAGATALDAQLIKERLLCCGTYMMVACMLASRRSIAATTSLQAPAMPPQQLPAAPPRLQQSHNVASSSSSPNVPPTSVPGSGVGPMTLAIAESTIKSREKKDVWIAYVRQHGDAPMVKVAEEAIHDSNPTRAKDTMMFVDRVIRAGIRQKSALLSSSSATPSAKGTQTPQQQQQPQRSWQQTNQSLPPTPLVAQKRALSLSSSALTPSAAVTPSLAASVVPLSTPKGKDSGAGGTAHVADGSSSGNGSGNGNDDANRIGSANDANNDDEIVFVKEKKKVTPTIARVSAFHPLAPGSPTRAEIANWEFAKHMPSALRLGREKRKVSNEVKSVVVTTPADVATSAKPTENKQTSETINESDTRSPSSALALVSTSQPNQDAGNSRFSSSTLAGALDIYRLPPFVPHSQPIPTTSTSTFTTIAQTCFSETLSQPTFTKTFTTTTTARREKSQQKCIICLGEFHFINKCPTMTDVSIASQRWLEMVQQLEIYPEATDLRTTIKIMSIKLNPIRAQIGLAPLHSNTYV